MIVDKARVEDPIVWYHLFIHNPLNAIEQLYSALVSHGYFDISTLWRQFYDPSAGLDTLRWYSIGLYIFGCALFLIVHRNLRGRGAIEFAKFLLPNEVWRSRSFRIDVQYLVLSLLKIPNLIANVIAAVLLVNAIPLLISRLNINFVIGAYVSSLPSWVQWLSIYAVAIISYEFGYYWAHRLLHRPFFWQFHKVHHYSRQLNMLVGARFHPVDGFLTTTFGAISMGLGISLLMHYNGVYKYSELDGLVGGYWWFWPLMALPTFGARFVHSHVPISYGKFDYLFVSPAMHIVHHARNPELHDLNFGSIISLWDWVFGTMHRHDYRQPFDLGITEFDDNHYLHIVQTFVEPFGDAFLVAREAWLRIAERGRAPDRISGDVLSRTDAQ
jgi:sterol desaturase/sphingolipid hydroxylase (fatty acid hydroxylase superfamily)